MKSIGISEDLHTELKKYCKRNSLNMNEYIKETLAYFKKTGADPTALDTPEVAIKGMEKRLDQVIGVLTKFEHEKFAPGVKAMISIEQTVKAKFGAAQAPQTLDKSYDLLIQYLYMIFYVNPSSSKFDDSQKKEYYDKNLNYAIAIVDKIPANADKLYLLLSYFYYYTIAFRNNTEQGSDRFHKISKFLKDTCKPVS